MRNVLVIAGPGGEAFGNEEIDLLTSNIEQDNSRRMLCVGNGVEKIENRAIASKLEEISQNGDDTTIIIQMHGTEKEGQFYFINDDSYISSRELFEIVNSRFKDKPVDIVITSCHSGACLKDKDLLPKGSVVGALSQGNETTAGSDVKNFIESLLGATDEFTTYNLVKLYLCELKNRIPPEIGISGEQGTLQLDELLRNSIGKKIDKSKVINLLKETISAEEIEELINKIETSRNEYGIYVVEYGKAIVVCATNEFGKDINHENYKSMKKNSRTMSPSSAYGFFETVDGYSTPIGRQSALNGFRRIIENSKDMDKGKEME